MILTKFVNEEKEDIQDAIYVIFDCVKNFVFLF